MNSPDSNSTMAAMMTPWLHFPGGDHLFFSSLMPGSKGAVAAASIVLLLIAVFERWVFAMRGVMEVRWRARVRAIIESESTSSLKEKGTCHADTIKEYAPSTTSIPVKRVIPPFVASIDLARGAFHTLQAFLHFTLMLAVMTFQAAYLISIILGLGIGEMAFGRLSERSGANLHCL